MGALKFRVNLQEFSKVSERAVCGGTIYLGITNGTISYLLPLDTITTGYFLITANLVALKKGKLGFYLRHISNI